MTNRKCFAGARLAQLVEHQTFNLRPWVRVPYRAQWNTLCLYFIWKNFFLFIENVHHFSNFFQLIPVLFSCAISDFLYEESGCNAYSC